MIIVKMPKARKKVPKTAQLKHQLDAIELFEALNDLVLSTIERVVIPELQKHIEEHVDRIRQLCREGLEISEELQEHFGLFEEPKSRK